MDLAERILAGDVRAAARLMRMLDDGDARAAAVMSALHPRTGRARIVGVTGSPGAGKSTLIDALIAAFRSAGRRVGVVAVDPTSPFTGGAILGDRVRMQRHATDPGVFIRSLATRGRLGGLSASTGEVVSVLDAMGYERVVVETVGVGQDEVEVVGQADVVVVVVSPGQGDEVQAHKAGVLEIADVLVVNKADVAGADRTARDLHLAVDLAAARARHPKVLRTVASTGDGVPDLVAEVERLLAEMDREGRAAEVARARAEAVVADMAAAAFAARIREVMASDPAVRDAIDRVHRREAAPRDAADLLAGRVVAAVTNGGGP
jgi:LAO/AO transport system kinase